MSLSDTCCWRHSPRATCHHIHAFIKGAMGQVPEVRRCPPPPPRRPQSQDRSELPPYALHPVPSIDFLNFIPLNPPPPHFATTTSATMCKEQEDEIEKKEKSISPFSFTREPVNLFVCETLYHRIDSSGVIEQGVPQGAAVITWGK